MNLVEFKGWIAVFLVVFAIFDVGGTVLAIVALKVAVSSRREDCQHAEVLRAQNRAKARRDRTELPKTLALLHLSPSPKLVELSDKQLAVTLKQNAHEDCGRYADRALPW